jgi:hypothetical protein
MVWCNGFTGDLFWVRLSVLDDAARIRNDGYADPVPGLWFVGFRG